MNAMLARILELEAFARSIVEDESEFTDFQDKARKLLRGQYTGGIDTNYIPTLYTATTIARLVEKYPNLGEDKFMFYIDYEQINQEVLYLRQQLKNIRYYINSNEGLAE